VEATLSRTPLYERHVALGARMVPFAGYEMPVQYEGVIEEHRAVRTDAGAFDVSHMGQLHVEGPTTEAFLQSLLSNDLGRLADGEAQYCSRTGPAASSTTSSHTASASGSSTSSSTHPTAPRSTSG